MDTLQRSTAELELMLGQRQQLLELVKTRKLACADQRLVLFRERPVGIIARRPGSMLWFSTARSCPFYSIADASLSLVADLWRIQEEGGPPAVREKLRAARKEADRLGVLLEDPDYPEGVEE